MALWRAVTRVAILVALIAALLPATASAASQWLPGETLDAADAGPDVTADAEGNSATVWVTAGIVRVAERPRGGPWGDPEDVAVGAASQGPKIVVLPDGKLVVLWVDVATNDVMGAQRPVGGAWSSPVTLSTPCCIELVDLVAGSDGTAMGIWYSGDGPSQTATLPPGADSWDGAQDLSNGSPDMRLAVAPDGSAEVASPSDFCGPNFDLPCILTQHRAAGGDWVDDAAGPVVTGHVTGNGLVANPNSSFTLVWGEDGLGLSRSQNPDGAVRSADYAAGAWSPPDDVSIPPGQAPGCPNASGGCIDLAADGDGGLLAVWQQSESRTSNLIRSAIRPAGAGWDSPQSIEGVPPLDAFPRAAFTGNGIPVAVWRVGEGGPNTAIRGAHRDSSDTWVPEPLNAPATLDVSVGFDDVVGDGEGNAITGWRDQAGVGVAGFDGIGPNFTAFSISNTTTPNEPIHFAAAAEDNWSGPPAISWLFGDGGAADGNNVDHAYASAGDFVATATAADGAGNTTEQSGPVTITAQSTPTPTPTPTPDPCGTTDRDQDGINDMCDDSDGAAAPQPFRTVNATVVSGDVFVKERGVSSATASQGAKPPKGFRRLEGAETIGVGSTVDTAKGVVTIRSAADTRRHTQIAKFNAGRFLIRQIRKPRAKRARRRSNKLITDMRLTGSSFRRTCRTTTASVSARRRLRKRVRRLFGDGRGSFRTTGRNAAATVKGTRWGVQDRCDGTLVSVFSGRVTVRDFVRKRTITVRAPRRYLARLR